MPKRIKKPPVEPEKRLEWLKRYEQGETPPQISERDHFDVRTIRKHIDLARMERDVQLARSEVLRSALEGHYRDLLETALEIEKQISNQSPVLMGKEQPLVKGLREHMPRSPLWENLRKWNKTLEEVAVLQNTIQLKIQTWLEADGRLNGVISKDANSALRTAVDVLVRQVKKWANGEEGLKMDRDIHLKKNTDGGVIMRYGFASFSELENEGSVEIIKTVLRYLEDELNRSETTIELETLYNRLKRIRDAVRDIITVIRLRRIITGKCKYCPI